MQQGKAGSPPRTPWPDARWEKVGEACRRVVPISEQFLHFAAGGIHDSVGLSGSGPHVGW